MNYEPGRSAFKMENIIIFLLEMSSADDGNDLIKFLNSNLYK